MHGHRARTWQQLPTEYVICSSSRTAFVDEGSKALSLLGLTPSPIAPAAWQCWPQSLLAAREKRQGQNRLPSLIFYHHHQRQIILVAVLFSQLSDRVLGIRKCRRYIRQVCVTRMVLDPIPSVYRKGISWHRTFQNRVTATAANKNEPQARYVLKGSFVTSVGFGAESPHPS